MTFNTTPLSYIIHSTDLPGNEVILGDFSSILS